MSRYLFTAALLCWAWAGRAEGAANNRFQGLPVVEISFSPPAQPIPQARLSELIAVRVGAPLDPGQVRASIEALFATGRFADIQVDAARSDSGVKITFITAENWFIGPVTITGLKEPPSLGQLLNASKLQLGELYSEERVALARQAFLHLLASNGLHQASVQVEAQAHSDTQQIDVLFQVQPGVRARFGEIRLAGKPDLNTDQVRSIAGWTAGLAFTRPRLQRGLEKLRQYYQKQDHLQAAIRLLGEEFMPPANRVDLELEIQPGPRVEVAISGPKLSRKQLRRYLPIYEEGAVDRDLLVEGARNLRDYFQSQGYYDAKVDYAPHPEENGRILVEFQVLAGERHNLLKLEIDGNRYFDRATIRERIYLRSKSVQFRRGRFSQSLLRSDAQAIEELYRSNGFLEAKVESRLEDDYQGKAGNLVVFLSIEEGPQTLVSQLTIAGNREMASERFLERLSSVAGQPFSEFNVASDRNLILAEYFSEGFPDATLEWKSQPGPEPYRLGLEYLIKEGRRQYVHRAIVDGFKKTRESVVDRQVGVYAGEPLSQAAMIDTQRRLYDLGIFSKVDMAVQNPEGVEENRNVLFQVEEARRWTFGFGGGAEIGRFGGSGASSRSPSGATRFSPRLALEVSRLNLRGTANTLSFRSRLSDLQQSGLFTYQAPNWRGRERLTLTASALYDTSRKVPTFSARRAEGALQLQHRLSKPSSLFYRYSYRHVSLFNITNLTTILRSRDPKRVGLLSASFVQDRRDDPLDAKRGVYNSIDWGVAGNFTGAQASFVRLLGQDSTYHPIARGLVLARTTQFGALSPFGGDSLKDIPLPELFFSGGSNSHRGFPINQAGPRDSITGFPIGGSALLFNSLELRFPVRGEDIAGVVFHDAGNIFERVQDLRFRVSQPEIRYVKPFTLPPRLRIPPLVSYGFDYMVHAVGAGVRYRTPIGPIRLDLAYSINPPRYNDSQRVQRISHFQFHFSLGQTF